MQLRPEGRRNSLPKQDLNAVLPQTAPHIVPHCLATELRPDVSSTNTSGPA